MTSKNTTTSTGRRGAKTRRRPQAPAQVTIRGRISTTVLPAGETATVEMTPTIRDLMARGYIERA